MNDPIEAARLEHEHPGREISQAEQDSWLKGQRRSAAFDPAMPVSPLAARLLAASNGLHSHAVDGTPASEAGTTRHAGWKP